MAFLAKRREVFADDKDFLHYSYDIKVNHALSLDKAMQEGASDTSLDTFTSIAHYETLFPVDTGRPVKQLKLLLVCFRRFMHHKKIWDWAVKNRLDSSFAHPRSVLAFGAKESTFCIDVQQKVAGVVTFKPLMPHLGQKHVLALYYNDTLPANERKLRLDPYTCGWAAHHWFCFEFPPRS